MACSGCGGDNRERAVFCAHCGARLCPACGAAAPVDARYCDRCGVPLARTAPAPAEDAEHRPVTVLFADAVGSTELTQRIGDEEAYRLVQRAVAVMVDAVDAHHGTVTQFRGDGVMALFGAPVAREDSAVEAVTAALAMQAELDAQLGDVCPFRVGVHTGPVVVGRLADRVVVDITAIGDTANVASRLEQAADPGAVWLSEATWRVVRDYVECEAMGPVRAKGVREPVRAYRAVRRTPVRTRLEAASARGLSRFVGRENELALLEAMVGRGQAVLLVGEAGIGKSRLLWELRSRVGDKARWIEGQCSATGSGTPWLPVVDLLRHAVGVDEATPPAEVAAAIDAVTAGPGAPYLKWLLRAVGDEAVDPEPQTRRAAIHEALRSFAVELARHGPVVVLVEDVHWADEASKGAIAALADVASEASVVLLATTRPGYDHAGADVWTTKLGLDQLGADEAAALAAGALDAEDLPAEVRALVAARTDGNPLFVEEVAASLVETGALRREGGHWVLDTDPTVLRVPATLQEVILARVDRLEPEARSALQLASVIGREFTRTLLDRIARLDEPLDGCLRDLVQLELIRQKSWFPELTFLFKHALTHEVTYSTLLAERRRELHRVVALAIEELYRDRVDDVADELARHWLEAGDERRALDYLESAAAWAMSAFSVREALASFRQAVDLCRRVGDDARLATFATGLGGTYLAAGDMANAEVAFDEGIAAARRVGDADNEATNLGWRAYCEVFSYRFSEAATTVEEALATDATSPDARLFPLAVRRVAADVTGHLEEVAALETAAAPLLPLASIRPWSMWHGMVELRANWRAQWDGVGESLARFDELPGLVERAATLWTAGMAAAGAGRYAEALDLLHRQLEMADRLGEVVFRARTLNTLGWVHADLCDHDGAVEWNERCIAFLRASSLPDVEIESNARLNLADTYVAVGRLDDAARELAAVEPTVRTPTRPGDEWMRWRYSQHWFHAAGALALARGLLDEARALADECLAAARATDSPKNVVKGLRLRAEAFTAAGDHEAAGDVLTEALAVAEVVGNPPQLWRTLLALAQARALSGDLAGAAPVAKGADDLIASVVASLGDHPLARSLAGSPDAAAARALL